MNLLRQPAEPASTTLFQSARKYTLLAAAANVSFDVPQSSKKAGRSAAALGRTTTCQRGGKRTFAAGAKGSTLV